MGLDLAQGLGLGLTGLLNGYMGQKEKNRKYDMEQQKLGLQKNLNDAQIAHYKSAAAKDKGWLMGEGLDETGNINPAALPPVPEGSNPSDMRVMQMAQSAFGAGQESGAQPDPGASAGLEMRQAAMPPEVKDPGTIENRYRAYNAELKRQASAAAMDPDKRPITPEYAATLEKNLGLPPGSIPSGATVGNSMTALGQKAAQDSSATKLGVAISGKAAAQKNQQDFTSGETDKKLKAQKDLEDIKAKAKAKAAAEKAALNDPLNKGTAKDYLEYTNNGGYQGAQQEIANLAPLVEKLRKHDSGMLGGVAGFMGDKAVDLQDPELADIRDRYRGSVAKSLKALFGARPAAAEYLKQLEFSYNPRLSNDVNAARMEEKINALKDVAESKRREFDYFEKNKHSMSGFSGATAPAPAPSKYARDNLYKTPPAGGGGGLSPAELKRMQDLEAKYGR